MCDMQRQLNQLEPGDRFEFISKQSDQTILPEGIYQVVTCWGVRIPDGTAIDPWIVACRDANGSLHNFVLPARVDIEVAARQ